MRHHSFPTRPLSKAPEPLLSGKAKPSHLRRSNHPATYVSADNTKAELIATALGLGLAIPPRSTKAEILAILEVA